MGTGKLDFHKITEWLVERRYKGWIICEDECHEAIGDPDGVTRQNGQWCRENLHPLVGTPEPVKTTKPAAAPAPSASSARPAARPRRGRSR
jgi:hypothetical protein